MGGGYTHQTKGTGMALAAAINKMKVELDALRRAIANLGIQIDTVNGKLIIASGRSLEVDGSEMIGGTLDVTGPATFGGDTTIGGSLSVTGTETVGGTLDVTGNMIVGGTLSLPNGIIDNAALANPISFGQVDDSASGISIPTSNGTLLSATMAVPSGFTKAAVMVVVEVGATSPSGGVGSNIFAKAFAGSVAGDEINCGPLAGQALSTPASLATTLTGLSGSFSVGAQGHYNGTAPAAGSGNAHVAALAIFAR